MRCERCGDGGISRFDSASENRHFAGGATACLCNPCCNAVTDRIQTSAAYKGLTANTAKIFVQEVLARNGTDTTERLCELHVERLAIERRLFRLVVAELKKSRLDESPSPIQGHDAPPAAGEKSRRKLPKGGSSTAPAKAPEETPEPVEATA